MTDSNEPKNEQRANNTPQDTLEQTDTIHRIVGDEDQLMIRYRPNRGPWRRLRFERRTSGPGWWRLDDEWSGCRWRPVEREVVENITIVVPEQIDES